MVKRIKLHKPTAHGPTSTETEKQNRSTKLRNSQIDKNDTY